jgi:hypothetical protein
MNNEAHKSAERGKDVKVAKVLGRREGMEGDNPPLAYATLVRMGHQQDWESRTWVVFATTCT